MLALWAEMNLALADQFRDGNVSIQEPLSAPRQAFGALPEGISRNATFEATPPATKVIC